jgi:hypothetical protein
MARRDEGEYPVGVFQHGHGLLVCHVWKTIEVFVEAQAAFQVGEQAVHWHAVPLKQGAPLNRSGSIQMGTSGGALNCQEFLAGKTKWKTEAETRLVEKERRSIHPLQCFRGKGDGHGFFNRKERKELKEGLLLWFFQPWW